jgi:hypothetical protein
VLRSSARNGSRISKRSTSAAPPPPPHPNRDVNLRRCSASSEERIGKRTSGSAGVHPGWQCRLHQIMWARWIEVAVEHELEARRAYLDIVAKPESDAILREFRASQRATSQPLARKLHVRTITEVSRSLRA